eukprot:scaffold44195_cov23-Cyclotella_meneghiniana.AAC.7
MSTLKFVRAYIDDSLCFTKRSFEDHLNKLSEVLMRLQVAGLKVNACKCFWGTDETEYNKLKSLRTFKSDFYSDDETEYLGYILTRDDGIKPQPKKVEAILAIKLPTEVKELRRFLVMVQYYQGLWAKRSKMLVPLTDLVGECGYSRSNRKMGKKKVPWHWNEVHQIAFDNVKAAIAKDVAT